PTLQSNPNFRAPLMPFTELCLSVHLGTGRKRRNAKEWPYAFYLRNTLTLNLMRCERNSSFPSVLKAAEERTNNRLLVCSQNYPRPCELPTKEATKQSQSRFFSILLTRLQILHLR